MANKRKEREVAALELLETARGFLEAIVGFQKEWKLVKSRIDAGWSTGMGDAKMRQWSEVSSRYEEFAKKTFLPALRELSAEEFLIEKAEEGVMRRAEGADKKALRESVAKLSLLLIDLRELLELSRFDLRLDFDTLKQYRAHDPSGWLNPQAFYAQRSLEKVEGIQNVLKDVVVTEDALDSLRQRLK